MTPALSSRTGLLAAVLALWCVLGFGTCLAVAHL